MARDPDGKPIETRGRRSISQKTRDFSDRMKGLGDLFEGSPRLLETSIGLAFIAGILYLLRPKMIVDKSSTRTLARFRGEFVNSITVDYPDRYLAENVAVVVALVVARGSGDIGSLLVPAGSAYVFKAFIANVFPDNQYERFDVLRLINLVYKGQTLSEYDVTFAFYTKVILVRWMRALMIATFFYILVRYIRNVGGN